MDILSKIKQTDEDKFKLAARIIIYIYTIVIFGVFPLLYHDRYNDILHVKSRFFFNFSIGTFIVLILIFVLAAIFGDNRLNKNCIIDFIKKMSVSDYFVIAFAVTVNISWLYNPNKYGTFWGTDGRRIGYLALIICVISYFLVSRLLYFNNLLIYVLFLSAFIVFTIAILNYLGYDPLDMFEIMPKKSQFMSTMGNRDCLAAYIAILLPIGMTFFCINKDMKSKVIYGVFCAISFLAAIAVQCDSIFIVIGAVFIVMLWFALESIEGIKEWLFLSALFFATIGVMKLLINVRKDEHWALEGLAKIILNSNICWFLAGIFTTIYILFTLLQKKNIEKKYLEKSRTIIFILITMIISAIFAATAYTSIFLTRDEAIEIFGKLGKYLHIDSSWGTERGRIWSIAAKTFKEETFIGKIIGYGPASFRYAIETFLEEKDYYFEAGRLIDAHNEFFQYLVTLGIGGVVTYFGIFITNIKRFADRQKDNVFVRAFMIMLIAFLVQGFINNTHIYIEPFVFILMGIGQNAILKFCEQS